MRCNNASGGGWRVVSPQCLSGEATTTVVVNYDEDDVEAETLLLCDACTKHVKADARGRGYKVRSHRFEEGVNL